MRGLSHGRYPSDDINKFLWMVRIGGGVFPDIKEKDYLANGQYRIDGEVTKVCFVPRRAGAPASPGLVDAAGRTTMRVISKVYREMWRLLSISPCAIRL